jgi:hypothetical protein
LATPVPVEIPLGGKAAVAAATHLGDKTHFADFKTFLVGSNNNSSNHNSP